MAPADSKVAGNNRVLNTTELDTKINIPTKDNIKLIKLNNTIVDNTAIKDSKTVNIAEADPKLDMLANNLNNIVLNKDRDATVNKAVGVIEIKLSSINTGITTF